MSITNVLLIRHGSNDSLGKFLSGRLPGIHLNERGKQEAMRLAEQLSGCGASAIYSSPLERAAETAAPLADKLGIDVQVDPDLIEIDFGSWAGRTFSELNEEVGWRGWNTARGSERPPAGESMAEVQQRIVRRLEQMRQQHGGSTVALVSHGDVIKAALMAYLGIPLDNILRFEISPASVSRVALAEHSVRVECINWV